MTWLLNGLDLNHCRINQHKYFTNCRYRLTYGKWYDWALRNHSWITTWNILSPDNCWLQWTLTDKHGIMILLICLVICLNKLGLIWGSYWKLDAFVGECESDLHLMRVTASLIYRRYDALHGRSHMNCNVSDHFKELQWRRKYTPYSFDTIFSHVRILMCTNLIKTIAVYIIGVRHEHEMRDCNKYVHAWISLLQLCPTLHGHVCCYVFRSNKHPSSGVVGCLADFCLISSRNKTIIE